MSSGASANGRDDCFAYRIVPLPLAGRGRGWGEPKRATLRRNAHTLPRRCKTIPFPARLHPTPNPSPSSGRGIAFAAPLWPTCAADSLPAALALALVLLPQQPAVAEEPPRPPVAERKPVTSEHHGIALTDDYAWLQTEKLEEVLQNPEALEEPIRRHLEAESAIRPRHAGPQPGARAPHGGGDARRASAGATRRCRSRGGRGNTTPATRSAPSASCTAGGRARADPSRSCSTRTCWPAAGAPSRWRKRPSARTTSSLPTRSTRTARSATRSRSATSTTGQDLADTIPEVRGGAVWSKDGQWLFYVGRDPSKWGQKVFRHRLGTPDDRRRARPRGDGGGLFRLAAADAVRPLPGDRGRRLLDRRRQAGRSRRSDRAAADDHRAQAGREVRGDGPRRSPGLPHQCRRRHRLEDRRQARDGRRPMPRCGRSFRTLPGA